MSQPRRPAKRAKPMQPDCRHRRLERGLRYGAEPNTLVRDLAFLCQAGDASDDRDDDCGRRCSACAGQVTRLWFLLGAAELDRAGFERAYRVYGDLLGPTTTAAERRRIGPRLWRLLLGLNPFACHGLDAFFCALARLPGPQAARALFELVGADVDEPTSVWLFAPPQRGVADLAAGYLARYPARKGDAGRTRLRVLCTLMVELQLPDLDATTLWPLYLLRWYLHCATTGRHRWITLSDHAVVEDAVVNLSEARLAECCDGLAGLTDLAFVDSDDELLLTPPPSGVPGDEPEHCISALTVAP